MTDWTGRKEPGGPPGSDAGLQGLTCRVTFGQQHGWWTSEGGHIFPTGPRYVCSVLPDISGLEPEYGL